MGQIVRADPTITTLVKFNYTDGAFPLGNLCSDAAGNIYGTTDGGGTNNAGTAFELPMTNYSSPITLANFSSIYGNGGGPAAGLLLDSAGDLYGTQEAGGASGGGTAFELSGPGDQTLTNLATFTGSNGMFPLSNLIQDSAGNLYGTTSDGTNSNGTVFELSGADHETLNTLATFNGSNGSGHVRGLVSDSAGNLYGVMSVGGTYGLGIIFELSGPNHATFTTLVNFNSSNGAGPDAALTLDSLGNLYGTTNEGGTYGYGTVFELSGSNHQSLTTLINFNSSTGVYPFEGTITIDGAGDLFGTTTYGGTANAGTVFEISGPSHQNFQTLLSFDGSNYEDPYSGLLPDANGNLYGTTSGDFVSDYGTVYELSGTGFVVPEPLGLPMLLMIGAGLLRGRTQRPVLSLYQAARG